MTSELLDAALAYARSGWFVFPVEPPTQGDDKSGKAPIGSLVPNGKDDATTDEQVIRSWWARAPSANIGIAVQRSGLAILDVDVGMRKDGTMKRGRESLAEFDAQLADTLTAVTGGGGMHAVYSLPPSVEAMQLIGFRDGLDLIGKGYIVVAPSRHYTGGLYAWANIAPVAPLPPVLCAIKRATAAVASSSEFGKSAIHEGGRNNALFRLGAALRGTGIDHDAVRAALHLENRRRFTPPLGDDEVDACTRSVMTRVHPERDVAMGSVVDDEFARMFPQPAVSVSAIPDEATAFELLPALAAQSCMPVSALQFEKLNDRLGGLAIHDITLIIAGTGKGKSSLATQMGVHHARTAGPMIYYVGEMTREHVVARIVGQILGRSWRDVLRGKVTPAEAAAAIERLPLYLVKRCEKPIEGIARACSRAYNDGFKGTPMVIVDYVQLLAAIGNDMRVATMQAVRDMQHFVEAAPVTAVLLSQSSRGGAQRIREGADNAEDLGDTGAETAELERSATNQLVLSFTSKDGVEEHPVTMMVAKSRFGGGSRLGFTFNGKTGIWTPTDKPPTDQAHEQRCAEIKLQLKVHAEGKCLHGQAHCGKEFTRNLMGTKGSAHKISGSTQAITQAVQDLVELKEIVEMGNTIMLK